MVISFCFLSKDQRRIWFGVLARSQTATTPSPARLCQDRWYYLAFCSHFHFHQQLYKRLWAKGHNIASCYDTCQKKPPGDGPTLRDCSLIHGGLCCRKAISQAVYSAPSADLEGLWELSASPATDLTSQIQSKHGAFPSDLSSLFLNLWFYAALL